MRLPNAQRAEIDQRKLSDYCLSTVHPVGKHQASVFRAALGIGAESALVLREMLLKAAVVNAAVAGIADEFGSRFQIDFPAATEAGSATIRSVWIIRTGEDFPRLLTCYVLTE